MSRLFTRLRTLARGRTYVLTDRSQPHHQFYVWHGNEEPKLHELIAAFPPEGGMAAYLADMDGRTADEAQATPLIDSLPEAA